MRVVVSSAVNPKEGRVNIRYRDITKLPPLIAKFINQLTTDAANAAKEQGWEPGTKSRLSVELVITMDDRRADLDGPLKRTLDALAAGLRFNDSRVDYLSLRRRVGTPGIVAVVTTVGEAEPEEPVEAPSGDWYLVPGETSPRFS